MKHLFTLPFIFLIAFTSFSQETKTAEVTNYYFIRHAEKDQSNPSEKNPHLMDKGLQRADNWSTILGNIHFDAVYSTDYNRTKETAEPTASKNGLEITIYDPRMTDIDSFLDATKGKTVLVVGHSNTIPEFVNKVIGEKKYQDIDDDNNGNLYIVTIINGAIADQVLTIN
jgi:broad specificity phosphatase PhoE